MKKAIAFFSTVVYLAVPALVFAQQFTVETQVLSPLQRILKLIIPIIITLAVIYFFWGVIKFITAKDENTRIEGRKTMINGIVGLFVILSIWGIIALLQRTFGLGGQEEVPFPGISICGDGICDAGEEITCLIDCQ